MANFLIADDSLVMRKTIKNLLEQLGHQVIGEAENGLEVYNKFKELKPDGVLMDIEMPVMDGFTLIAEVRKDPQFSKLPILVQTSLAGEDIKKKVTELGADAYQVKLDREKVLLTINELLEARKQRISHA